ncbi:membrane protein [Mycobacterium phage Phillis]|nr:membrane protein [Mycobacterium phage Phillis]
MQIGLSTLLFIVFLILKLTGVVAWSWLWVTAPLWIAAILFVLSVILLVVLDD